MNGQKEGLTDEWVNGWMNRQIDSKCITTPVVLMQIQVWLNSNEHQQTAFPMLIHTCCGQFDLNSQSRIEREPTVSFRILPNLGKNPRNILPTFVVNTFRWLTLCKQTWFLESLNHLERCLGPYKTSCSWVGRRVTQSKPIRSRSNGSCSQPD